MIDDYVIRSDAIDHRPEECEPAKMKTLAVVAMLALIALFPAVATAQASDKDIVVELVDKTIAMFKQKGKDETIKALNSPAGPLRKGALYAFAVTFDGKMLSHPVHEDLIGKDIWEPQDAQAEIMNQEFVRIAKDQGQGWYHLWIRSVWIRSGQTEPTMKRTYIRRVPGGDILVGAGYYVQ